MLCWGFLYYLGQASKDLCRLPRPAFARKLNAANLTGAWRSTATKKTLITDNADGTWNGSASGQSAAGVICLEAHYAAEYGMPSTHAVNSLGLPWAVVLWSVRSGRCQAPLSLLCALATFYTTSSTLSRLYFGVHSHFDLLVGLAIGVTLLAIDAVIGVAIDLWILAAGQTAAVLIPTITAFLLAVYPKDKNWKSTPGDTALVVGATTGVLASAALDAQRMFAAAAPTQIFGALPLDGHAALVAFAAMSTRLILGWSVCLLTRAVTKPIAFYIFSEMAQIFFGALETTEADIAAGSRVLDTPAHLFGLKKGKNNNNSASSGRLQGGGGSNSPENSPIQHTESKAVVRRRGGVSGGGGGGAIVDTAANIAAAASNSGINEAEEVEEVESGGVGGSASTSTTSSGLRIKAPPTSPRVVQLPNELRYAVELPTKLFVYASVGVTAFLIVPRIFESLGLR